MTKPILQPWDSEPIDTLTRLAPSIRVIFEMMLHSREHLCEKKLADIAQLGIYLGWELEDAVDNQVTMMSLEHLSTTMNVGSK